MADDAATLARSAQVTEPVEGRAAEVLTPEALAFLAELHRTFDARRLELLAPVLNITILPQDHPVSIYAAARRRRSCGAGISSVRARTLPPRWPCPSSTPVGVSTRRSTCCWP